MTLHDWLAALERDAALLLGVSTALLALGAAVALAVRRRPHRQVHLGGTILAGTVVWGLCALLPLPRWTPRAPETPPVVESPSAELERGGSLEHDERTTTNRQGPPVEPTPETGVDHALGGTIPNDGPLPERPANVAPRTPAIANAQNLPIGSPTSPTARPDVVHGTHLGTRIYLWGSAATAAFLALAWIPWMRWRRTSRPAPDWMTALAQEHVGRNARVVLQARLQRPLVGGLRHPRILLPEHLAHPARERLARYVLLHECGHVAHGDLRDRWIQALACVLFWFHPLFWILRTRLRFASELLADAYVVRTTRPTDYAREILTLAERHRRHALGGTFFPALFTRRSEFYRRMTMLLKNETTLPRPTSARARLGRALLTVAWGLGVASGFGVRDARAQDPGEVARLRDQVAELRADRDRLRAEVQELRNLVEHLRASPRGTPEVPAAVERGRLLEELYELRRRIATLSQTQPPTEEAAQERNVRLVEAHHRLARLEDEIERLARLVVRSEPAETNAVPPKPGAEAGRTDFTPSELAQRMEERIAAIDRGAARLANGSSVAPGDAREAYVLDLVYRAFDLGAELGIREGKLEETAKLAERGFISRSEVQQEQIAYRSLQRKLQAVRTLVAVEREATQAEIEATRVALEALAPEAGPAVRLAHRHALLRLEGRLTVLKQVE